MRVEPRVEGRTLSRIAVWLLLIVALLGSRPAVAQTISPPNPTALAFGSQTVATMSAGQSVSVGFSGLAGNLAATITGPGAADYVVTPTLVAPGASSPQSFTVTFTPTATGARNATLTFSSPGATNRTVALTGTGALGDFTYNTPPTPPQGFLKSVDANDGSDTDDGLTASFTASAGAVSYRFQVYDIATSANSVPTFPRTVFTTSITVPETNPSFTEPGLRELLSAANIPVGGTSTFFYVVEAVGIDGSIRLITDPSNPVTAQNPRGARKITLLNGPQPTLSVSPTSLTFRVAEGVMPAAQSVTVSYTGVTNGTQPSRSLTGPNASAFTVLAGNSGDTPDGSAFFSVRLNAGLPVGHYEATLRFSYPNADSSPTVTLIGDVTAEPLAPTLSADGSNGTSVTLSYMLQPTPTDAANLIIVRSTSGSPNTVPTDGQTYMVGSTIGNAQVVAILSPGAGASGMFTDMNVSNGVTYGYSAFAFSALNTVPGSTTGTGTNYGPGATVADVALPVELTAFTGTALPDGVRLEWRTASERDNARFIVERSANGGTFAQLTTLPGGGTTTTEQRYSYTDRDVQAGGQYRYRLADLSRDGVRHQHTVEVTVTIGVPTRFALVSISPNPFNPSAVLRYDVPTEATVSVSLYSLLGTQVAILPQGSRAPGRHEARLDGSGLASGVYLCRIEARTADGKRWSTTQRVTLAR